MSSAPSAGPLRVFISGTMDDLNQERRKAAEEVAGLGCAPLLAETEASASESSEAVCVRLAGSCDLYVGIFGLSYGSIPPAMTISVTEMEFDTARGADPTKILIFSQAGTPEPKQAAFLKKVGGFADGYFYGAPFSSPDELAAAVRKGVAQWIAGRVRWAAATPSPAPATVRPRRPATDADFAQFGSAFHSQEQEALVSVLKDLEALSYRVQVEQYPSVMSLLWRCLRGSIPLRVETLRIMRTFIAVTEPSKRAELERTAQHMAQREFAQGEDLPVKQEALNLLSLVVTPQDLDMLIKHVVSAPDSVYNECRPLYAFMVLKTTGHEAAVRAALYEERKTADDPRIRARIDELLEYLRYQR